MAQLNCPLRQQAIDNPQRIALYQDERTISYRQLDDHVEAACAALKQAGLKAGQSLACCDENSLSLIVLLFACLRFNVIYCPINFRLTNAEKGQMLQAAGIDYCWQADDEMIDGIQMVELNFVDLSTGSGADCGPLSPIKLDANTPATIIFTSGSNGLPKAAVHSLYNHYYSAKGAVTVIPLNTDDCWLATLPFFHIGGLAIIMRGVFAGAAIALTARDSLLQNLQRYPVTHASMVPTQLYRWLERQSKESPKPSKLKYLLLGGAPINSVQISAAKQRGISVYHSYGLTEMCSQVATSEASQLTYSEPLPFRQWQIVNDEICVRGETLFLGYWVQGRLQPATRDGWFFTGDLALQSTNGVSIVGRRDNRFICGGENYQPEAVEKIISEFNEVLNVVIVPVKDDEFGELPLAFVEWRSKPQVEELKTFLKTKLASFRMPRYFRNWPELNQATLKISRRWLMQHTNKK